MHKNFVMVLLTLLLLLNGWSLFYFPLPFHLEILVISAVAVLLMSFIKERFVFLYAITLVLSYGLFLIVYAFANNHSSTEIQLQYMYSHLLFTSFILLFWILLHYIKSIGYENESLKQQIELLQKYKRNTMILTINEFQEQAKWVLTSVKRNKKQAWLIELKVKGVNNHTRQNFQESIEVVALSTVRKQFDLITSTDGFIYILLKNTNEDGAELVLHRINNKLREKFNLIEAPFIATKKLTQDKLPLEEELEVSR